MSETIKQPGQQYLDLENDFLQDFLLVNGQYTAEEAKEILMCLISSKLTFHTQKNLRSIELTGRPDHTSKKRIEELGKMRLEILKLIEKAEENGMTLSVNSDINIKLINGSN